LAAADDDTNSKGKDDDKGGFFSNQAALIGVIVGAVAVVALGAGAVAYRVISKRQQGRLSESLL
jgi:hypothetical protein